MSGANVERNPQEQKKSEESFSPDLETQKDLFYLLRHFGEGRDMQSLLRQRPQDYNPNIGGTSADWSMAKKLAFLVKEDLKVTPEQIKQKLLKDFGGDANHPAYLSYVEHLEHALDDSGTQESRGESKRPFRVTNYMELAQSGNAQALKAFPFNSPTFQKLQEDLRDLKRTNGTIPSYSNSNKQYTPEEVVAMVNGALSEVIQGVPPEERTTAVTKSKIPGHENEPGIYERIDAILQERTAA